MNPSSGWEPPSAHVGSRALRSLLDAVFTVGSDLDLAATLRRITEAAVALVDARYGALGVVDESGTRLAEFITVGVDDETHRAIGALPKGLGLLGAIIDDASSRRVADLHEDPESAGFPPNHPPMTSFLGVPIRTRDRVFGNLYLTDKTTAEAFTDIDQELVEGLASAAAVAIDNARLHAETARGQATLAAFQRVAQALLDGAGRDDILGEIAARAKALAEADLAAIVLPIAGSGDLRVDIAVGAGADRVHQRSFGREASVSGQVLTSGAPILLEDVSNDPRVGPFQRHGDLGPTLFVPLQAGDGPFGTLVVARRLGTRTFAAFEQEIVTSFAGQAGLVVHHERQRARLADLALLEDRDRIARDLHDTVVQGIFATGMTLQGAARLIDEAAARERVTSAVDQLDDIARHIRTVIFGLEAQRASSDNVRRRALAVVEEAGRALGHEPRLSFDGPVDSVVDGALADDVVSVLRESLSNVARHARSSTVEVRLTVADAVVVTITDDGIGVDPDAPRGQGLRNFQRAAAHGGTATLEPGAGGGTVVTWRVPVPD